MLSIMMCCLLLTPFTFDRIVAIVGDQPILHSDVETLLVEAGYATAGDYTIDSGSREYLGALDELVEQEILVEAARISGYYPSEAQLQELVDEEILRILEGNSSDAFYTDYLRSIGLSPGQVPASQEESIRAYLSTTEFLSEYLASAGMNMSEYRSFLADFLGDRQAADAYVGARVQAAMMSMPVSPVTFLASNAELVEEIVMPRHLAWIYFTVLPSGPDLEEARSLVLELRSRILAGESFEALAMEWSQDGSAASGGYLGAFGPGQMVPIFENAARGLAVGELSQPVVTSFGVHLIRLDDRRAADSLEASHILIQVPVEEDDVYAMMEIAAGVRDSILTRDGISFEEAAAVYSTDPESAEDGGDLGIVPLSFWPSGISDTVSILEPGEISDPLMLQGSGAVVLVKRYPDSGEMDWSMYTDQDLDGIVQQVIYQDAYNALVDSLSGVIPVVYSEL